MIRPYQDRTWNELLKARDAFCLLKDRGFESLLNVDGISDINDEIDYRYQNNNREG